jgi:hypothetical protein
VGPAAPRAASSSGLLAALTHQYAAPPVCHAAECRGRPPPPTYPTACHAVTRESRPLCVFAPVFCFLPRLAAPARGRGAHARPQPQPQGSGACSTFRTLPPTFASWLSLSLQPSCCSTELCRASPVLPYNSIPPRRCMDSRPRPPPPARCLPNRPISFPA